MDARLWHQQATTPPRSMPTPIPVDTFDEMSETGPYPFWWTQGLAAGE